MPEDELDGCAVAGEGPYTADDDLPYVALFAGVDAFASGALEQRAAEWRELFG